MPSLYRKWRSRSFDDLIGQEHIVRTLRNAVRTGRVAHAYLFTGPRGTGKTSTARILAKAVNCLSPQDGNPDNTCEACVAADEGRAIDVIEIDAASNTSVDNVRDLRERVAYAAGEGRYKVYIVDEVHRLSGAAFDAFLKTLEEPPPHVIFVFASTEPQKVPGTIASRCQRFDFRRISAAEIVNRLAFVGEQESLVVSREALQLIALHAAGSLRDALGLLDQVTSYTGETVDEAAVRTALGLADSLLIVRLVDALLDGNVGDGLQEGLAFVEAGGDPVLLTRQLLEYWRDLLLVITGVRMEAIEAEPSLDEHIKGHAPRLTARQATEVIRSLTSHEFGARYNLPTSLPFELGYVSASLALQGGGPAGRDLEADLPPAGSAPVRSRPVRSVPPAPLHSIPSREATEPHQVTEPPKVTEPGEDQSPVAPVTIPPGDGTLESAWPAVLENLRTRNRSLQAVLKSGYLLSSGSGEATVGFLYEFHYNVFSDVKKRRVLEQVIAETIGTPYRVTCLQVSKEQVAAARGSDALVEDDGFISEVAERIRDYHLKQLQNGSS